MELQISEKGDSSFSNIVLQVQISNKKQFILNKLFLTENKSNEALAYEKNAITVLDSAPLDYIVRYYISMKAIASMKKICSKSLEVQKREENNTVRSQLGSFDKYYRCFFLNELPKPYQKSKKYATETAQIQPFFQNRTTHENSDRDSKALVLWVDPKKTQPAALKVRVETPFDDNPSAPDETEILAEVNLFDKSELMPAMLDYHFMSSFNDRDELSNASCLLQ